MPYLECRNLKYNYPTFHLDMDFSVEKGEFVCMIGPSGSGKSTLLSLIAGIKDPDGGSIILNGRDITSLEIRKRRIGMVFQDFSLFPSMDVAHNIQYGMKDMTKEEKEAETERLLELAGLSGYGTRQVHELSGGEAQRVALVRAIAAKPDVLLLDEPLSALDAPLRRHLRTVIRQIHEATGITMLYVTHDREEAFAVADRIMVMRRGNVEAFDSPEEIYRHPASLFVANFTGDGSGIPVSCITGEDSENVLFFRPEDTVLGDVRNPEGYLKLEDATLESCEFNGANYIARLSYKGYGITAFCTKRPAGETVTVFIPKDAAIELR